ncbi:MAG: magnesium transporter [Thermodesulfobacteriota bacterium]
MTAEAKELPLKKLKELLKQNDSNGVNALLSPLHHSDIAKLIEGVTEDEAVEIFRLLDNETASEVILEIEGARRELLVSSVSKEELVDIIEEMETDDATDVISELPEADAIEVLEGIEAGESIEVQKLLKYPDDTAGGKMQAELVSVREDLTVRQTIEEIRKKAKEMENISTVFVVDSHGKFFGTVALDKLILADEDALIRDIADKTVVKVTTDLDQEEVAKMFQRYDLISMPVVDRENRLVGRITIDDIVDVIEEEMFEDFYKMANLNVDERVLDEPMRSFKLRVPWLLINLATAFLAASVVKIFEGTIETLVILAVLMPIVAGMGGNAATQAITVVTRGLALGELDLRHAKRVLLKEATVGFMNGVVTGAGACVVAYLLGANIMIGVLLFLAMTVNLAIAGISGATIPLLLKRFGFDPAVSSSIFVTTCTDIGGFFTFLGLATVFLKIGLI